MSTLSATITADTSQFNAAVSKAKGELENFTDVSKKQRSEFDKAVRTIDRVRQGYVKGERATDALNDSVRKLIQLHKELKVTNRSLADSMLIVASSAIKEKTSFDNATHSVNNFKRDSNSNNRNLARLAQSFLTVNSAVGEFAGAFGLSGGGLFSAISKISGPIAAVTASLAAVYQVVKSNETLFDAFQKRVEGVTTAFSNFKTLIGNGEFSINVLMKSYEAGKKVYNAKDDIGTAQALNSPYKAKLDARLAEAKLRKTEGDPKADAELDKLRSEYSKLYEEEKTRQTTLLNAQIDDLKSLFENEDEEVKERIYKDIDKIKKALEDPTQSLLDVWNNIVGYIDKYNEYIEYANKKSYTLRRDKLRAKDEKYVEALKKLKDTETSHIAPLALTSEQIQKLEVESSGIQGEVEEARNTEQKAKSDDSRSMHDLYNELWSLEKVINEEREKEHSKQNTGLIRQALDKYKEIEGKLYKRFALFESPDSQAFWKEWTDVEHAKLENKNVEDAIEEARANLLKYANEHDLTVEEFLDSMKKEIAEFSNLWSWYGEVTDRYFNTDLTENIINNLGSSEDMRRLIQRSINKEVAQITSKYPDPKSPSYFKEVAGVYDKHLPYLVNYENEIESLQRKQAPVQEELDDMISGVERKIYEKESKNLEYIYKSKLKRYAELVSMDNLANPQALEDADNAWKEAFAKYSEYNSSYKNKVEDLQNKVADLDKNINELKEGQKPYQEMKAERDNFLQQAGIRPYPAFEFNEYDKEEQNKLREQERYRIEQIGVEVNAVNNLASAWSNLWEMIGVGNNKTKQTIQALGSVVMDATNMFKTLAENELAASQAVALGKATSSASGLPFPYNLVAMGTVAAAVTSMFAKFNSIGKFAEGGIVGGNSTIGDYNLARVNSGEMILNGTQQKRLFNMLNGEGGLATNSQPQTVELVIRGKDLVGTFNNYNNRLNRVR